jgi:hypothetical protein
VTKGSPWDELHPEEINIVRQAVAFGDPITRRHLAPAAIAEADRVLRTQNRNAIPRAWIGLIVSLPLALFGVATGASAQTFTGVALAILAGGTLIWNKGHPVPEARRAAATKASAERLLREE